MKIKSILLVLLALVLTLSLVACGDKKVTAIEITEGLPRSCEVGAVYDFSAVKAKITYNDDSVVEVTGADLTFGELNTNTIGTKALTVTYEGFTITVDIKVYGAAHGGVVGGGSTEGGTEGGNESVSNIYGVEMPDSLVAYGQNANRFTDKTVVYTVGDDNPFAFTLKLNILDDDDNWVTTATRYESLSKVYLVTTEGETEAGAQYVTVNEENNTFDFTDTAVGKTFRIQTRPANVASGSEADCTRSLTVRVVNGYNVTDVKELNLMTNDRDELHEKYAGSLLQNDLAKEFIDRNYGAGYYDTYGGDNLGGLVFHCDLTPTVSDIPADYVVTSTVDGTLGFDNQFAVYSRYLRLNDAHSFRLYGNYFTLNTSNLPLMSNDPAIVGAQESSNSSVFRFGVAWDSFDTLEKAQSFDYTQYEFWVEDLAMRDINANENVEENSPKRMRGLNAFETLRSAVHIDNSIIEAYTISVVSTHSNTALSIEDCIFSNAWQNHLFVWAHNFLQCKVGGNAHEDVAPWSNHTRNKLDIKNSKLTKCGGPVILSMKDNCRGAHNDDAGVDVTVDAASELWSYVTGSEAWFKAYAALGAEEYARSLKAMDVLIRTAATAAGKTASITTTQEGTGETAFMNLVFAALNGDASYTVDGTVLMDSSNATVTAYKTAGIPAVGGATLAGLGAPLMQSTTDLTATATYLNGAMGSPDDRVFNPDILNGNPVLAEAFFEGDLLNFFMGNDVAVVMGYFHPEA